MVHLHERDAVAAQDADRPAAAHPPARMTGPRVRRPPPGTRPRLIRAGGGSPRVERTTLRLSGSDPPASGHGAVVVHPPSGSAGGREPRRARVGRGSGHMARLVYELRVRGPIPAELLEELGAEDFGEEPPL